jgi:hypothetical protein
MVPRVPEARRYFLFQVSVKPQAQQPFNMAIADAGKIDADQSQHNRDDGKDQHHEVIKTHDGFLRLIVLERRACLAMVRTYAVAGSNPTKGTA